MSVATSLLRTARKVHFWFGRVSSVEDAFSYLSHLWFATLSDLSGSFRCLRQARYVRCRISLHVVESAGETLFCSFPTRYLENCNYFRVSRNDQPVYALWCLCLTHL